MNLEEYLDRLIERREYCGEAQIPVANDDVAASLAAAKVLAQLQEIDVPPEFASQLELSIRTRACSLAEQNGETMPMARPQSPAGSQRFARSRSWVVVFRLAAVLTVVCVGVLTASARSLPGDALYGLKQAEKQFTLTFANNPQNRASAQIDQLSSALVDLNTVVNNGRDDEAVRLALDTVAAKTSDGREAVAALPAGSEHDAAQRGLNGILAVEDQTLRHLLNNVDWPIRLALTQQLGALSDPVPSVTHVTVSAQSNGTLLLTLTGTNFAPNAELIIDGLPGGMVSQSTSDQLVAVISNLAWSAGEHALGLRNPDGTAAQVVLDGNDNENNQPGSDHSRHGTPVPRPTGGYDE